VGDYFRANVGALITDGHGRVLAFARARTATAAWQLPQGGIGRGESPRRAAYREVAEETGLARKHLVLLAEAPQWLSYELPTRYRSAKTGRGQTQKWFVFRFVGRDRDIRPDAKEFVDHRWMTPAQLLRAVVRFRRPVYERLFREFRRHLTRSPRARHGARASAARVTSVPRSKVRSA
jgi:putative (di)nucleoside polyphosphate hydrolase